MFVWGLCSRMGWEKHSARLAPRETLHPSSENPQAHSALLGKLCCSPGEQPGPRGGKGDSRGKCHFQSHSISKKHESAFKPSVPRMLLVSLDPASLSQNTYFSFDRQGGFGLVFQKQRTEKLNNAEVQRLFFSRVCIPTHPGTPLN